MQFKLAAFATLAVATLAIATPTKRFGSDPSDQCNTGVLQCCQNVQPVSNPEVTTLAGLIGATLEGVTGLVGLTCSGVTVIGAEGTSCTAQPVCCTGNSFNGVLALGCSPFNGNL